MLVGQKSPYDILIQPKHLIHAHELISEFLEQFFVIDHMAKPNVREGEISQWRKVLEMVAKYPNVFCKVSGFAREANWMHWD